MWHAHAEGVLRVALTNLNLPSEAWRSARLLRAVPNWAASKKVSFAFQQKSSTMPIMNPSPTEIVELFTFVEVT